jgi:outer membrane protein TolC
MNLPVRTRRLRLALQCLLLGAAIAGPARGAGPSLSLDEAVRLATAQSPRIAATQAQMRATRERAVASGQRPDPVLKAGINNLPVTGPDRYSTTQDFMTMRSIGVMQEITRSDKLQARGERALRESDLAVAGERQARADVQRAAALAWLERSFRETERALLDAQLAHDILQVQAAEALYRGGKGAQADVFAARGAVELTRDRIAQAERQVAVATTLLARWIGATGAQRQPAERPEFRPPAWTGADLAQHLATHPPIAAASGQEALASAEADVARTNRRSDWSVELMYSQRGPSYSNMVSINVSIPVQWDRGQRQDRELAAALALRERAAAERDDMLREYEADVRAMLAEWRSNEERLKRYDASLVPLARQRSEAALAAYRAASGSLADVIEARRGETQAQLDRLAIELDSARLWARLNYLIPDPGAPAGATGSAR